MKNAVSIFFLIARLLNLLGNCSPILIMLFYGRVLLLYAMPCLVINVISYAIDVLGEKFLLRSSIYSKCLNFIKNGSFSLIFINMGAPDLTWMNIRTIVPLVILICKYQLCVWHHKRNFMRNFLFSVWE